METYIYINKTSPTEIANIFNKGINDNAVIKYYDFINETKCKVLVRHSEDIILKENATYTFSGFLNRTISKKDKLKAKLHDLEIKLYEERIKQHKKLNGMGWGHAMRCVKCSISTTREDRLKEKIEEIKKQINNL